MPISKFKQMIWQISLMQNSLHPKNDNFAGISGTKIILPNFVSYW